MAFQKILNYILNRIEVNFIYSRHFSGLTQSGLKKRVDARKPRHLSAPGFQGVTGFPPWRSLAGVFEPFCGKVEKLRAGVAVKDGASGVVLHSTPSVGGEGSEDRTLTSVIRTETEVVIVTSASGTLLVVGLPPEKEADRFLAEGIIRVHEVGKIEAAKPRGVNDGGATPTTLEIGAREPRRNLACGFENTGTLPVHTENDTTGVRGGEDGNVATGDERCSHCVSRFRFSVSALEHS